MATHDICQTCGSRGNAVPFEGGTVYAYNCTAEVVVTSDGKRSVVKRCPDFGNASLDRRKVNPL